MKFAKPLLAGLLFAGFDFLVISAGRKDMQNVFVAALNLSVIASAFTGIILCILCTNNTYSAKLKQTISHQNLLVYCGRCIKSSFFAVSLSLLGLMVNLSKINSVADKMFLTAWALGFAFNTLTSYRAISSLAQMMENLNLDHESDGRKLIV